MSGRRNDGLEVHTKKKKMFPGVGHEAWSMLRAMLMSKTPLLISMLAVDAALDWLGQEPRKQDKVYKDLHIS